MTDSTPAEVKQMAHEARQRILDGKVDATGKENPDGPRMVLNEKQLAAHARYGRGL